jgi:hypothetical protein
LDERQDGRGFGEAYGQQMLKRLRRWLGWDSDSSPLDFSALELPLRPRGPKAAAPKPVVVAPKQAAPRATPQPQQPPKPAAKKPAPETLDSPRLLEILDNPKLTLDRPKDDGFDPYNTGAFNRSASWEKISRHKKR